LHFHSHDCHLGYGLYKQHQVPSPTSWSAIMIRSPTRVIDSLCSGVSILGTKCWQTQTNNTVHTYVFVTVEADSSIEHGLSLTPTKSKSKSHYKRQSVSQSVLVSGTHLGPAPHFFFLLKIFFGQLRICYFVAPSLMRGRFFNLLLLLVLARAVPLGSVFCQYRSIVSQ
jgi:hypothetical protein